MSWAARYPEQKLVPYDTAWPSRYRDLAAGLKSHLGPGWVLEHVGSTSVPGLVAKPVIDVAVRMPQCQRRSDLDERLRVAGWSQPAAVDDHVFTVFPAQGVRVAIGHLFTTQQWPEAHVRLFAAWLRANDHDRDQYALLKQDLVDRGVWGSAYTASKGAFVAQVVDQARANLGLTTIAEPL